MILFGVNFNAYFLLLMRKFRRAAASEEVRGYFVVIALAVCIITANIYSMNMSMTKISLERVGHRSKSQLEKPVVVMMEPT